MTSFGDRVRAMAQYRGSVEDLALDVERMERDLDAAVQRAERAEADARTMTSAASTSAGTAAAAIERLQLAEGVIAAARVLVDTAGHIAVQQFRTRALADAVDAYDAHVAARLRA